MTRYRALNDWTTERESTIVGNDGETVAKVVTEHCTLEETGGRRWAEGCWRVRIKAAVPGGPRSKTWKGETAWMSAQRYHEDAVRGGWL